MLSRIPGAQACVLVFSTTDRESFQAIDSWREKVEAEVGDIPTVLVQNKIDLLEETVIKKQAVVSLMRQSHSSSKTIARSGQMEMIVICLVLRCSEEAEGLAKRLKLRFYRASVKEDLNVTEGLHNESNMQLKPSHSGLYWFYISAFFLVFKYLAEKYLQRLKQQTAEETEVLHTTSNKIGKRFFSK